MIPALDVSNYGKWEEAYAAVESYFCALGIRDRLLLAHLIGSVLLHAESRISNGEKEEPSFVAMEETRRLIGLWFQKVTGDAWPDDQIETQSVLALLLADMPGEWQQFFLRDSGWPDEFADRLRKAYLEAGPRFRKRTMTPQALELGPVGSVAGRSVEFLDKAPQIRLFVSLLFWVLFTGAMVLVLWGI